MRSELQVIAEGLERFKAFYLERIEMAHWVPSEEERKTIEEWRNRYLHFLRFLEGSSLSDPEARQLNVLALISIWGVLFQGIRFPAWDIQRKLLFLMNQFWEGEKQLWRPDTEISLRKLSKEWQNN